MHQNAALCGNGLNCDHNLIELQEKSNSKGFEEVVPYLAEKMYNNFLSVPCYLIDMFNPFPNKSLFLPVCSTSLLKTLQEKEKLLMMSNFSFFCSVFYPLDELSAIFIQFDIVVCKLFQFGRVQNLLFGKGLRACVSFFCSKSIFLVEFNKWYV